MILHFPEQGETVSSDRREVLSSLSGFLPGLRHGTRQSHEEPRRELGAEDGGLGPAGWPGTEGLLADFTKPPQPLC